MESRTDLASPVRADEDPRVVSARQGVSDPRRE